MKNVRLILTATFFVSSLLLSCDGSLKKESITAKDESTIIKEITSEDITIGNQIWMCKNLNVDKFLNGDNIPEAKTYEEWEKAGKNAKPAWCYFNNDPANGEKFGKLYNWYAVNDPRGLAPEGWRIPSYDDWYELANYLGNNEGLKMKSEKWFHGTGNNESGFSGLPSGQRDIYGRFNYINNVGFWWSSTEKGEDFAKLVYLSYTSDYLVSPNVGEEMLKGQGLSVRCLK